MKKDDPKIIHPGGVEEYIALQPSDVQSKLQEIRSVITTTSPGAIETVSYFGLPGYSYPGYDYNGMFVWFSFKKPSLRLHVRPPVLKNLADELALYTKTASIINFSITEKLPNELVRKLVLASLEVMKTKEPLKKF